MNIVYHIASMGDWKTIIEHHFKILQSVGLNDFLVNITHVGPITDSKWIEKAAKNYNISICIHQRDDNIKHYETFAMLLIERMAKETEQPFLYFHTKGVSASWHSGKNNWRKLMEREILVPWRNHLQILESNVYDAIGVNWCQWNDPHFSGNFWMARADWIRKLPDFVTYHHSKNLERTSCEFWIGSAQGIRPKTLCCSGHQMWFDNYNWSQHGL